MQQYIATFYTHAAALISAQALTQKGLEARMTPVPRALSSSCGTCVRFSAASACLELLDEDVERVYLVQADQSYQLVHEND